LKDLGYNPGPLDGYWGKATENAVNQFQHDQSLAVTGLVDIQTKSKLGVVSSTSRSIRISLLSPTGAEVIGDQWLFVMGRGGSSGVRWNRYLLYCQPSQINCTLPGRD